MKDKRAKNIFWWLLEEPNHGLAKVFQVLFNWVSARGEGGSNESTCQIMHNCTADALGAQERKRLIPFPNEAFACHVITNELFLPGAPELAGEGPAPGPPPLWPPVVSVDWPDLRKFLLPLSLPVPFLPSTVGGILTIVSPEWNCQYIMTSIRTCEESKKI